MAALLAVICRRECHRKVTGEVGSGIDLALAKRLKKTATERACKALRIPNLPPDLSSLSRFFEYDEQRNAIIRRNA
jgi:hypothetical protein